jgi:hypothetical protein
MGSVVGGEKDALLLLLEAPRASVLAILDGLDDHAPLTTPRPPAVVFAFYRDQCARSNAALAAADQATVPVGSHPGPLGRQTSDLRRIVLHLIEETDRHAGHLDIVRQLLDGRTGLGPR